MPTGPRYVLDEKNFAVTSILTGNPSLAVINGRSYAEGDVLRMPKGQRRANSCWREFMMALSSSSSMNK